MKNAVKFTKFAVSAAFCRGNHDPYTEVRGDWERFYKRHFGLDVDFSRVDIPPGEGRILIIAKGVAANTAYAAFQKSFKCWKYTDDLDFEVKNARTATEHYAIRVLDGAEPDTKFLGKSVQEVDPDMKFGETLTERLVHGLKYYDETGKHLDMVGVTYCSGSRSAGGGVPLVGWHLSLGKVTVSWYDVGNRNAKNGIRQEVSAPLSARISFRRILCKIFYPAVCHF